MVVHIAAVSMTKQRRVQMLQRVLSMDARVVPAVVAVVAQHQLEALQRMQVMEMPVVAQTQLQLPVAAEEKDQPVTLGAQHRIQVRVEMAQLQQSPVQQLLMQVVAEEAAAQLHLAVHQ